MCVLAINLHNTVHVFKYCILYIANVYSDSQLLESIASISITLQICYFQTKISTNIHKPR